MAIIYRCVGNLSHKSPLIKSLFLSGSILYVAIIILIRVYLEKNVLELESFAITESL